MRRPFVAGNWKMNPNRDEAVALAEAVQAGVVDDRVELALCVPFPHLGPVQAAIRNNRLSVGAQDVYWEPKGAFTGEVSVAMLEDYCRYVIIGHSERRELFGETDGTVNWKLAAVLASKLDPIVCVGEQLAERRAGHTESVLSRQLRGGLAGHVLSPRITIAYEPIWAIGTGETASPEVAQETCAFIRSVLREIGGGRGGPDCRALALPPGPARPS
ncbi:MAG: triose-phosphate isomerase family protein, partial [Tepidiformaceae bacterium]